MKDIVITMNSSGGFDVPSDMGRIEEYCAKRLKIKLDASFIMPEIKYYTLSFEPYSLSRKIITENIYRDSDDDSSMFFYGGYLYCPIYDYIAVSPKVMVQIDAYETDEAGNVTSIIKSGIFTIEFAPSLTGEGVMLETVRPDVKFIENVNNAVAERLKTQIIDGENLKDLSVYGRKLTPKCITNAHLQESSVSTTNIKIGAVSTECIAEKAVTSEKLYNNCITSEKLVSAAVTTDKIADKNVTSAKLADGSVANTKLANYAVSETKIRPRAVTTLKLADKSVTPAKLDRAYLTEHQSLAGYATEDWVKKQEYLTEHISLAGYATEDWVKSQNYLTEDISLDEYATKDWINEQNFITDSDSFVTEEDLPSKLSELENDVAVSFASQSLTEAEKEIARKNIDAVRSQEGKVLSSNDFTDEDKQKLDSALTEHQDISMKADISSLSPIAFSGSYNDLADLPENCGFSESLKENYDSAYDHSLSLHAPENAEANVIDGAVINGKSAEIKEKKIVFSVLDFVVKEPLFMEVY